MNAALLEIDNLHAGYRDVAILRGLSMHVDASEVVCVIGPNGAGKSSLLKAVMGLLKRFDGDVRLDGKSIARMPAEQHAAAGIGYVPQVANVFASLTVRENLLLSVKQRAQSRAGVEAMLAWFPELEAKLPQPAGSLSGGERQMLAIARCLILAPRLLLLDEPTAALSPLLVSGVFAKIREIAQRGTAILLVEQNAMQALAICDRAYVLSNGANAISGTGAELLANPRIKELYLGGHPADAVAAVVAHTDAITPPA
ncbi:MAG: ABC transporter ATP-binding protein [Janthinobacterium lividum]